MWILPKQIQSTTSASVLATKESGLDSELFSQICEKSLTWRGKDSLSRTWLQRWKRESWIQHLCSRTLRPSHTESFVDAWTSSLADSRANHSALLESVQALKTQGISSHTSETESGSANLELFSSKTLKELSQVRPPMESRFSSMSSESWKDWVIEQRQEYSQRKKSAHLIRESESLSWATASAQNWSTPTVMDTANIQKPRKKNPSGGQKPPLCQEVKNWPTATARDWKGCGNATPRKDGKSRMDTLEAVAKYGHPDQANHSTNGNSQGSQQWATPRANKVHPVITEENRAHLANRKKSNLEEDIAGHCGKATGKLNPDWVEQLMGLPVGWTDLGSWAME